MSVSLLNPFFNKKVTIPDDLRSPRLRVSIAILTVVILVARLSSHISSNAVSCHWNGVRCTPSNSKIASCKLVRSLVFKSGLNPCIVVGGDSTVDPNEAEVIPLILTMLVIAFVLLWMKSKYTDKACSRFAAVEFFACAIGNGLLTATTMMTRHAGKEESDLAFQTMLWLVFALLFFPSGGHTNASLTAGAWAAGDMTFTAAVLCIGAQVVGCLFAMECVRLLVPDHLHEHFEAPVPPFVDSGLWAAALWELVCTVLFILVSLGCQLFDKYYVVASTLVVALVRYTGATMDPLGAICGAWFEGEYSHQLEIFWAASIAGGLIAGAIWKRYKNGIERIFSTELNKNITRFATFEFFSCAVGNGLLTATLLLAGQYGASDPVSDLAFQAVLWLLFAWLYFPSGGFMNAALTAGSWAAGQCELGDAVFYLVAQTMGCICAMKFLRIAFPDDSHGYVEAPVPPYLESGLLVAAGYEMVCTILLVLVSLAYNFFYMIDPGYIIPSTLIIVLVRYTGASMDPLGAISLATFSGDYSNQLEIYWVASLVGGLIAGVIWKRLNEGLKMHHIHMFLNPDTTGFAALEFFSCALGNFLLAATVLVAGYYKASDEMSGLAFQAVVWMLFALLYFPTGGYMNAALTAGAWAAGQCTLGAAVLYLFAQTAGSLFGIECVRLIAPENLHEHFAAPVPLFIGSGVLVAGFYEFVCTLLFILVSLACNLFDSQYIVASTLVTLLVRYTGASMDPLGAICGAWFTNDFTNQLQVYWIASGAGGVIAGYIWKWYEDSHLKKEKVD